MKQFSRSGAGSFLVCVALAVSAGACSNGQLYKPKDGGTDGKADAKVDAPAAPDASGDAAKVDASADGMTSEVASACPELAAPAGGSVSAPSLAAGSEATYACDLGHQLTGEATRMCTGGAWSGDAPTCPLRDCGPLTNPTMGTVSAATTTYGATATYSCPQGYGPSGSSTRTCQVDGTWGGSQPSCVVANCPALPGPTGGSVVAPVLTYGATATYSCDSGYKLVGMATRTCKTDGTWSDAAPTCAINDCGALSTLANGKTTVGPTTYGATATFACNMGYVLKGAASVMCQTDGTWSAIVPTCSLADCGALTAPTNGSVAATVTTYGSTATYSCATGYGVVGGATPTCGADAKWSGAAPTCALKDCGALGAPTNGSVSVPTTTYGSTATYSCMTGFGPSGSATRTCQADGTWTGMAPACVIANCPALASPAGGAVSAPTLVFGATATYSCGTGYTLAGAATRTCQANGTWTGAAPTCTIADCGTLVAPTNGTVSALTTTYGATATYGCVAGYSASGALTRTCQAGATWSGTPPTCAIKSCPAVAGPTNGSVSAPTLTYGSTATYSCTTGYKVVGSATQTCQADATWSGAAPTCVLKDCGALTAPSNGSVSAPVTTYGSTATYACVTGYGPSGSTTRACQADATWSGTAPTCVIANCPALASPTGGSVSAPALTYGSTATYSCNAGYLPNGATSRTCQANGTWSATAPTCDPKNCGAPGGPTNGAVSAPVTTYGSTATYSCGSGYTISGSTTRTCQADATWSGSVPACVPVDCHAPPGISNGSASYSATTFGSTASYTCATNYTISGGGSGQITCLVSAAWSTPTPSCVDVCTLGGNGTSSHCCKDAACSGATPKCDTGTHTCVQKLLGEGCSSPGQCATGFCVGGVCCGTACNGACDASCPAGTCQHSPARTKCGTIAGPAGGLYDVSKVCDAGGNCTAPKVLCNGATRTCQLDAAHYCCDHGTDPGGALNAPSCGSPSDCVVPGQATGTYGEACNTASDCPLGLKCCRNGIDSSWRICQSDCTEAVCTASGLMDCGAVDTSCDPNIPECSTSCNMFSYTCN